MSESWRAWGRSPGAAANSFRSSKPRSSTCAGTATGQSVQVAKDFDLTETAVREWVKQVERDTGTRTAGGLTSTEQQELA
jgi:transposase-like protein